MSSYHQLESPFQVLWIGGEANWGRKIIFNLFADLFISSKFMQYFNIFFFGGASKTLSLFAPRGHLVLYRNRRNVR